MLDNFAFMLFEGGLVHAGNSAKSLDCLHEGGGRAGWAARRFMSLQMELSKVKQLEHCFEVALCCCPHFMLLACACVCSRQHLALSKVTA